MAARNRLPFVLSALLVWAIACSARDGLRIPLPPQPPAETRESPPWPPDGPLEDQPAPPAEVPAQARPDASRPEAPGARVVWREAPPLRGVPAGLKPFLSDVESRLPREMGTRYRDSNHITWCHETTHGVHSALRNRFRLPAFYVGGGKFALVEAPAVTLGEVAAAVPPRLRGTRYQTYLVRARGDWDRDPLYVWDEWVAYNNGTTAAIEEGGRWQRGASDDAIACIELSGYALAVAAAARRKGAPVSQQFREFLACELRRSLGLYKKAIALPAFAWHDRKIEQAWRGGNPFIDAELRALYGDALTARDLLR